MLAHGYRRFLPTKDHVFILDYVGTLFFLKNALVSSTLGQIQWKRACRYVVLCRGAKDVSRGILVSEDSTLTCPESLP
jgi:F-box protein 24